MQLLVLSYSILDSSIRHSEYPPSKMDLVLSEPQTSALRSLFATCTELEERLRQLQAEERDQLRQLQARGGLTPSKGRRKGGAASEEERIDDREREQLRDEMAKTRHMTDVIKESEPEGEKRREKQQQQCPAPKVAWSLARRQKNRQTNFFFLDSCQPLSAFLCSEHILKTLYYIRTGYRTILFSARSTKPSLSFH